jgi:hypothetical protein
MHESSQLPLRLLKSPMMVVERTDEGRTMSGGGRWMVESWTPEPGENDRDQGRAGGALFI